MQKILAVILLGLAGAGVQAQAPVVDLNSETNSQSQQSNASVIAPSDIEARLAILERKDASRIEAQQRVQRQLNSLQDEVNEIRGTIELHNHQLEKILQRQRELYLELDNRFNALREQTNQVGANIGATTDDTQFGDTQNEQVAPAQESSSQSVVSEEQAYQSAVDLILKQRDYDSAIPAFQNFLTQFPVSSFTDNAHYWLGQLLFNKQQWEQARIQFAQVVEKFPDSTKRADSIYKLGMLEKAQSNAAQAKVHFEQVIQQYPGSTSARLAQQQLAN